MQRYPSSLTDRQWEIIQPMLPREKTAGRPYKYLRRDLLDGVFYVLDNGIKWRNMPHDFPHWCSIYRYYTQLMESGIWMMINDALISMVRVKEGRDQEPLVASIDSQSVKGDPVNAESGFDGGKKVKGIKRHILVDSIGLILFCLVTSANVSDIAAGKMIIQEISEIKELGLWPRLQVILGDNAYKTLCDDTTLNLEISNKDASIRGFVPLPLRWKVERAFAWLTRNRRLGRHVERLNAHHEQLVYISNIRLMLKRLA